MAKKFKILLTVIVMIMICISPAYNSGDKKVSNQNAVLSLQNPKTINKMSLPRNSGSSKTESEPVNPTADKVGNPGNTIVLTLNNITDLANLTITEKIVGIYENTNSIAIEIPTGSDPAKIIAKYEKNSTIKEAYVDQIVELFYVPSDPQYNLYQWNLKRISMESAWDTTKGQPSVVVAVIDTGFGPYADADGIINGVDTTGLEIMEDTYPGQYSNDGGNHGTAVVSLIASTMNTTGIAGIAPDVTIMPIKVFANGATTTTTARIASGIRWAADHGADIINLSLGASTSTTDQESAIAYALGKGVLVVAASGNDGFTNQISYPAAYPGVIAVGSTSKTDTVSTFSNKGNALDLCAPGELIRLAYLSGGVGELADYNGTSFSSPTVAAIAALVKSRYSSYSNETIMAILYTGTDDLLQPGWDSSSGFGIINAQKVFTVAADSRIFDGNDTKELAQLILPNKSYAADSYPALDNDYYKFTLLDTRTVNIIVTPTSDQDSVVELRNAAGSILITRDQVLSGLPETLNTTLNAGTYYINVYDYYGDAYLNAYTIDLQIEDTDSPLISAVSQSLSLANGSASTAAVQVTVTDLSYFETSALKDTQSIAWPINDIFTENGTYLITAIDGKSNQSTFSFTIQTSGIFNVIFSSLGGTEIASIQVPINELISEPSPPSRTGYNFLGWYADAQYTDLWDFSTDTVIKNMTLFAKWSAIQYSITFDSQGGSSVESKTSTYGQLITLPVTPTKTNFVFGGWFKNNTLETRWNFNSDTIQGSMTLYAKWLAIPASPNGFKIESLSYNSVTVSWNPVEGASGYEVFRSTSALGTYTLVGSAIVPNFKDTTVLTGTIYFYKVRSFVSYSTNKGTSAYSSVLTADPSLNIVSSITADTITYNSIRIKWDPTDGASGYDIYRSVATDSAYGLIGSSLETEITDQNLSSGNTYYYKVRAYRWVNSVKVYSLYSRIIDATPIPSVAEQVNTYHFNPTSIQLTWKPVLGAIGYEIYRSTAASGKFYYLKTVVTTDCLDLGLTRASYYYKVRAYTSVNGKIVYGNWTQAASANTY